MNDDAELAALNDEVVPESVDGDSEPENTSEVAPVVENLESEPSYSAANPELDEFLNEATTTKAEAAQSERQSQASPVVDSTGDLMDIEEAVSLAIVGVTTVTGYLSEQTKTDLNLPPKMIGFAAMVFAPCVQKYGAVVKEQMKNMGDGLPMDSHVPEYLAGAGAAGLGGYMLWQYKKQRRASTGQADGD